jgi:hypothetical protein
MNPNVVIAVRHPDHEAARGTSAPETGRTARPHHVLPPALGELPPPAPDRSRACHAPTDVPTDPETR